MHTHNTDNAHHRFLEINAGLSSAPQCLGLHHPMCKAARRANHDDERLLLHVTVLTRLLHSTTTPTRPAPNRTLPKGHKPQTNKRDNSTISSSFSSHTLPHPNPQPQQTWQQDAQQDQEHTGPWPPCSSCWARCWSTASWCLPLPPPRAPPPSLARTSSRLRRPWAPQPCPSKPLLPPRLRRRRTPACPPPGRP